MIRGRATGLLAKVREECGRLPYARVSAEPGWESRGSASLRAVGVMDHWSATPQRPGRPLPSRGIVRDGLNRPDLGYFLRGPLYHVIFAHDFGQPVLDVLVIASGVCNHAGKGQHPYLKVAGNSTTLAVNADTDGTLPWSPRMIAVTAACNVACMREIGTKDVRAVVGHYEHTTRKIDPGRAQHRMAAIRAATAAHLAGEAVTTADVDRAAARTRDVFLAADAHGQGVRERIHDADVQSAQARDSAQAALALLRDRYR